MHDLLIDPSLSLGDGTAANLPTVLARLARGDEVDFARLRPHQEQPWSQFLVQVGALALARADEAELPDTADAWRDLLLHLTDGAVEPWTLVVEDLSKPAFFQPPVPEGSLAGFTNDATTPEVLDILVTAKNHDVKSERVAAPQADAWVYGLVTLQTMQGFSGRDNYGIARMNGGFASRPWVGLAPGRRWADRFARDVRMTLDQRPAMLADAELGYDDDGLGLLWTEPWDGKTALRVDQLDPFFVEICRRVRLVDDGGTLHVRWTTTKTARVDAKHLLGNLRDPWTPTRRKGEQVTALTVAESGLHYRLVSQLLIPSGEYEPAVAQALRAEDRAADGDPLFLTKVLVRGQGKTGGLHERAVPVPARAFAHLFDAEARKTLAQLAEQRIDRVAKVQSKILRPTICTLIQGAPDSLNFKDDRAKPFVDRLDQEVDQIFFEQLWADLEVSPEEQALRWNRTLAELARAIFEHAIDHAPSPEARHYRAIAKAERRFYGAGYSLLPGAFDRPDEEETDHAAA